MDGKTKKELSQMHWRERYEYEARREGEAFDKLSEKELVERVKQKRLGSYYQIWYTIGRQGSVRGSSMALWDFLQQNPGDGKMLHRYHCAAALFKILGMPDPASQGDLRKQVQWDHHGEDARQEALLRLKQIIEAKIKNL